MALDSTVKKRTNLLNIVNRLVKKTETKNDAIVPKKQEEEPSPSRKPAVSIRPYLMPPTPSSGPASPALSEQESVSEEEQSSDKGADGGAVVEGEKEEVKKDGIPKEPMRCDVCGLRVFKSYRYINRTSAPVHLKSFVTPDHDRIRVCKRCFSSRERCRQNLALILLRSKTSQMIHLRTPLGVTYNRFTKGIDYIARDLKKGLKRPYEDLLCDETMADEDEMEVDNERFLLNGDETKSAEVQIPKLFAAENGNVKQGTVTTTSPVPIKNIGIVTVVRRHSGKYSSTPNCFTIYGEVNDLMKANDNETEKDGKQNENGLPINKTETLGKPVDHSISLPPTVHTTTSSEIKNINNKLTFLDHAYALPPPKGRAPSSPKPVKSPVAKVTKVVKAAKQELPKKTATTDGETATTPERSCGIVCFLCDNLVTKSYSCYKKDNAPERIKPLFTPGVGIVKVCRRCMPYKKPKEEEEGAATGKGKMKVKIIKGKLAKLHSAKLIKNAKSAGKVNAVKTNEKTKVATVEKNSLKLPAKDEKKRKESSSNDEKKVLPVSKKLCSLAVQTRKMPEKKVLHFKLVQAMTKSIHPTIKEEPKSDGGKSNSPKGSNVDGKTSSTSPNSGVQKKVASVTEQVASNSKTTLSTSPKSGAQKNDASVTETANNSKTALSMSPKSGAQKNDASVTETANNSKTALSTSSKSGAEKNDASVTEKVSNNKTLSSSPKSGAEKDDASITEKASNTTVEKENATAIKQKSVKVDFGTQSMKSMIGIIKVKTKPTDSLPSNESVVKEDKAALLNANEGVAKKEDSADVDVVDVPEKQENLTEKTSVESKSSEEISVTEKATVLTNDLEANANAKVKNEEKMDMKATDADTEPEKDETSNKLKENQVETKELEGSKMESQNKEGPKEPKEDKDETTDSKNVADNIIRRGRRSASRSPVIAREVKSTDVVSPRKGRSSGTPDRKCEDKQIVPTVMTRKRLASFSESEADKKVDDSPGGKRRAVAAALLEKMSRKAGDSSSAPSVASGKVKLEHTYAKEVTNEPEKEVQGHHCMTRRNQMPVNCAGCNEKVVKSYRCVMRGDAPLHIKPLFAQQSGEILRICRKCVKKKEVGNAKNNFIY